MGPRRRLTDMGRHGQTWGRHRQTRADIAQGYPMGPAKHAYRRGLGLTSGALWANGAAHVQRWRTLIGRLLCAPSLNTTAPRTRLPAMLPRPTARPRANRCSRSRNASPAKTSSVSPRCLPRSPSPGAGIHLQRLPCAKSVPPHWRVFICAALEPCSQGVWAQA